MKKTIFLFAMLLSVVVSMGQATKKSVFLYAGQSNADGREYVQNLPDYMKVGTSPYNPYTHLKWASICSNPSKTDFGTRTMATGERYAFCDVTNYWIDQAVSEDFYAIKCAYGGTAIAPGVTAEKLPIWYADATWMQTHNAYKGDDITQEAYKNNNSLTKNLTEGVSSLIDGTLAAIDGGYDVKAIMWHQGESDRNAAGDYYTNFKTMITYMRQAIYAKTGDKADLTLPFIFGTVCRRSTQYSTGVEEAQKQVARDLENVYVIDMKNATLLSDNLHFDRQATEYLGKKMYNKLVELGLVSGNAVEVEEFPVKESVMDNVVVPSPDNRSWDFTSSAWSQATKDALSAEVALESGALWNWNNGYGYRRGNSVEEEQLHTSGGYVFPETEGLYFTSAVYNRIATKFNGLYFVSGDPTIFIPKMTAGQLIYVTARSANNAVLRPGIDMDDYVEVVGSGEVASSSTVVTFRVKHNVTLPTHIGIKSSAPIYIDKIQVKTPETVNILIGADQKETFSCDKPLDFSPFTDLFKAYVVTGYDDATGKIDCEQVMQVPANTGVLLVGEESTVNAPIIEGDAPVLATTNLLTAVVGSGSAPVGSFVLTTSGGVTQFTKAANAVTLNNQAYLASLGSLDAYDFNLMEAKTEHVYDMPTVLTGVSTLTFTDVIHHTMDNGTKVYCPANVVAMDGRFAFDNSGKWIRESSGQLGQTYKNTLYGSVVELQNGDRVKFETTSNATLTTVNAVLRGVAANTVLTAGTVYVVEAAADEKVNIDFKLTGSGNRNGITKVTVWTATETTPIYQVTTPTAAVELQPVSEKIYKAVATLTATNESNAAITYYYKGGDVADWTALDGNTFEAAKKAEYQFKATASGYADSEVLTLSLGYLYTMTKTVVDLTDEAVFTAATKDENGFNWKDANHVKITGLPDNQVFGHITSANAITGIAVQNNNTDARYSFAKGIGLACNYGYWVTTTGATAYDFAEYEVYATNTAITEATSKVVIYNPNSTQYNFAPIKAVRLYEPIEYSSEVTAIGWSTLSLPYPAIVPEGTCAYYVSNYTDGNPTGTLTLKKVEAGSVIPANEGFLLNAAEGTYQLKAGETPAAWTDNMLKGTADAALTGYDHTNAADPIYVLASIDANTVGFKKFSGTGIDQYKAYLQLGTQTQASAFRFDIDGETTSLSEKLRVKSEIFATAPVYDLQGRQIVNGKLQRGLYIVNGKKVVIK